ITEYVEITARDRARFRKLLAETRNAESLPIRNRLSDEDVAKFAVNRYRFEGVEIKGRLFRQYPFGDVASHVIGYMGRINQQDQQKLEDDGLAANYRGTDYTGKAGVEAAYEAELHGTTGFEQVEIDAAGRGIRTLSRTPSQAGNNLTLELDMRLQQVAEIAFGDHKKGGHGVVDLYKSIVESCDTYYYHLANDMGIDAIARFLGPFGFGSRSGIDLAGEFAGVLPSPEWKMKRFKQPAQQKWFP